MRSLIGLAKLNACLTLYHKTQANDVRLRLHLTGVELGMSQLKMSIVCCDTSPAKFSRIVEIMIDESVIAARLLETTEQDLPANLARDFHNAALHPEHGEVTYFQQVNEGGFAVQVGDPANPQETFFGPGSYVAFSDSYGPGHASKVGPEGVKRTFRLLKGHLED